jgi:hypothetical protein
MGLEATCAVRVGRSSDVGRARLEESALHFSGELRLRIPFAEMTRVAARAGWLEIAFAGGLARLELGPQAAKWASKILNPRGLMDKLGIKAGMRVSLFGIDDDALLRQVLERAPDVKPGRLRADSDLVLWGAREKRALSRLGALRRSIRPTGAIWVVWPKGRKELREDDVRAAAVAVGLVDVKVVSVSDTLSGLKLMIPVRDR